MEYQEIVQFVGSVGFPIVACGAIFYQMNKQNEQHRQEMDKISEALNNNTIAIIQLTDKLGGGE